MNYTKRKIVEQLPEKITTHITTDKQKKDFNRLTDALNYYSDEAYKLLIESPEKNRSELERLYGSIELKLNEGYESFQPDLKKSFGFDDHDSLMAYLGLFMKPLFQYNRFLQYADESTTVLIRQIKDVRDNIPVYLFNKEGNLEKQL